MKTHYLYFGDSVLVDIQKLFEDEENEEIYNRIGRKIDRYYYILRKQLRYENNSIKWYEPSTMGDVTRTFFILTIILAFIVLTIGLMIKLGMQPNANIQTIFVMTLFLMLGVGALAFVSFIISAIMEVFNWLRSINN